MWLSTQSRPPTSMPIGAEENSHACTPKQIRQELGGKPISQAQ